MRGTRPQTNDPQLFKFLVPGLRYIKPYTLENQRMRLGSIQVQVMAEPQTSFVPSTPCKQDTSITCDLHFETVIFRVTGRHILCPWRQWMNSQSKDFIRIPGLGDGKRGSFSASDIGDLELN